MQLPRAPVLLDLLPRLDLPGDKMVELRQPSLVDSAACAVERCAWRHNLWAAAVAWPRGPGVLQRGQPARHRHLDCAQRLPWWALPALHHLSCMLCRCTCMGSVSTAESYDILCASLLCITLGMCSWVYRSRSPVGAPLHATAAQASGHQRLGARQPVHLQHHDRRGPLRRGAEGEHRLLHGVCLTAAGRAVA